MDLAKMWQSRQANYRKNMIKGMILLKLLKTGKKNSMKILRMIRKIK